MPTVLVIGASRGLGLEFARQYADDGARVIATYRRPQDAARLRTFAARTLALDVTDAAGVAALGEQLASERLDVAILNAGVYGPRTTGIAPPSDADFDRVMHTNVLAPMRLIAVLAPLLAGAGARLVVTSSRMGSTTLAGSSAGWLYRASKAALNNVLKIASIELGPRSVVCIALHPGWARTDMGGAGAEIDVADSVAGMRRVIASADASHNGAFFNYGGERLAW